MPKTISNHQLTPDATYLVRGKVSFCRISRHTTDKEREAANQRRMHPIDKNYTTVSLYNATVLARDPANPTIEEQYAAECLYRSSSPDNPGANFSALNKSRNLPKVGVIDPLPGNPNNYKEIVPTGELAKGLDVTLVMRVFKGQGNNGVSLDRVLVNEPVRYYGNSDAAVDQGLASFGITFQAMPPEQKPAQEPEPPAEENPADVQAPPAPEMSNAFSAAPIAPAAQPAAAPAAAPAQQPAPAPAPAENPFSAYQAQNAGGQNNFGPGARQY